VVNGGFREKSAVELWLVPRGEKPPAVTQTVAPRKVKYREGGFSGWEERGCFPDGLPVVSASPA
jgi:hypothetical protein